MCMILSLKQTYFSVSEISIALLYKLGEAVTTSGKTRHCVRASHLNLHSLGPGLLNLLADLIFAILLVCERICQAFDLQPNQTATTNRPL